MSWRDSWLRKVAGKCRKFCVCERQGDTKAPRECERGALPRFLVAWRLGVFGLAYLRAIAVSAFAFLEHTQHAPGEKQRHFPACIDDGMKVDHVAAQFVDDPVHAANHLAVLA